MTRSREVAAHIAAKFAALIGSRPADAAHALMEATPAQLVEAVDALAAVPTLNTHGVFALGPSFGDDILPEHPREAMRAGTANPVPLIIGTNAHEGRLFTRILPLLPTTENRIEALLAGSGAATRDRIIEAYPDYPHPKACVRIGGDFTFASAVWEIVEARAAHAPTFVYRYDYAPRPLHWSGLGATHATELFAVFDVFETRVGAALTLAGDRKSARRVSRDVQTRWREFARTGVPGADWPRYSADERAVRVFDRRSRVEIDPHSARRSAWASFTD